MSSHKGKVTLEGKIVEVRDGSKNVRRAYTYGYRALRILVGFEYYSVLVNSSKLNAYGFLPRVGQWIRVTGRLSQSDDQYDPSISWISELEHIENPNKKEVLDITNEDILNVLFNQWQNLSQIASQLNVKDDLNKRILSDKLKELAKEGVISKLKKRDTLYWRVI